VSAAETLPETIWHRFRQQYGLEICEGIGTTELLHIFISNRPGACRPGTSGRPVPGYQVRVVGGNGETLPTGHIGDLEVTGESLMLGYWNRYRESREALCGHTMRTGDKYVVDQEGYFRFRGRGDDLFKINGLWVSAMEVEDILLEHAEVLECAVVPECAENQELESVTAYITLKPGYPRTTALSGVIRRFAKERLPHYKAPRTIHVVEALPRTATGKLDRKALRQLQVAAHR